MIEARRGLPTLADSRWLRFGSFTLLYMAQGLPFGVFVIALPAWLNAEGYGVGEVGRFVAAAFLPWSLKLVVGPVMDRFGYLPMGRRRPWVIGAQAGIVLSWLGLALVAARSDGIGVMIAFAVIVNTFAAAQDVATDGMAIDVLPEDERARANAFMFGGQYLGISAGSLGGALALDRYSLEVMALLMVAATAVLFLAPLLLRERRGERLLPWTDGMALERSVDMRPSSVASTLRDVVRALLLPMSLLALASYLLVRMAGGVLNTTLPGMGSDVLGWDATVYPYWQFWAGIAAAGLGVLVAPFFDRHDVRRGSALVLMLIAATYVVVGLQQEHWTDPWLVTVIMMFTAAGQVAAVGVIALFMGLCEPRLAATQFAVYMAWANLSVSIGAGCVGLIADFSHGQMLIVAGALVAAGALLLLGISLKRQERDLEATFAGRRLSDVAPVN